MLVHYLITVFCIVLMLVLLLIITVLLYAFYRFKIENRMNIWSAIIDRKIVDVIVMADEDEFLEQEIDQYSSNADFKKLFLKR